MCKIVEFPQKNELPFDLKDKVNKLAIDYLCVLFDALDYFGIDKDDLSAIEEVGKEITVAYVEQLEEILETMEEL